ncbi:MAG TPA: hypothetical protein P5186_24470 [Candidatus Paceibacterota bacterium]|nr:hypothetical protein [Verrucomicrobiota bacterium]HRY51218.1 hypothetical protein [Candidatus Paceibacterota bacterium]HSA00163.1 hypothetical protein [Candidatus Paceibacterota bacterium]
MKTSHTLGLLGAGLLILIAADVQAQLLFKTKFSALEGYTNGWMIGQPSIGNKWENANANWDWVNANEPDPAAYSPLNNGKSWVPEGETEPYYIVTATNTTALGGGQMKVASDGNFGTNAATYFWKMDIPKQMTGPITVTWDWQFICTNEIPADYDSKTNTYNASLPGFDHGFGLADYANRTADGDLGNPNWKYSELSTGVRLSSRQDCRYNGLGACGGGGSWFDHGPEFKDGKVLHMKTIMYVANGAAGDLTYVNTYDNFVQRDGEAEIWQTAKHDGDLAWIDPHVGDPLFADPIAMPEFGMRRCPGEADPGSGINCIMCWMNGNQWPRYALVSNIRVWGPDGIPTPTLRIEKSDAAKIKMTFTGWLQAADTPEGPYRDVALPSASPLEINADAAAQYYRAEN